MPLDGNLKPFSRAPRDLGKITHAYDIGQICEEAALVLAEWALEPPSSRAPRQPLLPSNRWEEKSRATWRENFARWYLYHTDLRPRLAPKRSIFEAYRRVEKKAEKHATIAKTLMASLHSTGLLEQDEIPLDFDPLAEAKLEAFRKILERRRIRKATQRRRLSRLDDKEGGFFRSLRSVALMRFVQSVHKPDLFRAGWDKAMVVPQPFKIEGLDMTYVEGNKIYRSMLRVDIDRTFDSIEDLREQILSCGVPLPNIVSWVLDQSGDSVEAIPRPHLIWLLDKPVWWKHGSAATLHWKSALNRLTSALLGIGADPAGMLNPMRVKNPLGIGNGWHVFDDVTWHLSDLIDSLPEEILPTNTSIQELDQTHDNGSQNIFRVVASHANRRARELRAESPNDGLERLKEEVLVLYEDMMRLRDGNLTPRQIDLARRQSERIATFGWTLAGRGRPKTPEEERKRKGEKTQEQLKDSYLNGYIGRSKGGDMRRSNNRKRLAQDLPLAIEACWEYNNRKPIRVSHLTKFIDASIKGLSMNWDIVMDICNQKNIPYHTPGLYYTLQAESAEKRHKTINHIKDVIDDKADWVPWKGNPNFGLRSQEKKNGHEQKLSSPSQSKTRHERFVPRARRRKLRLVGLPIGRPKTDIAELDTLQACLDEILARQGGLTSQLALTHNWSGQLLRDLNKRISEIKKIAYPNPMSKAQALALEAHKIMWHRRQVKQHSISKAIKQFPRIPKHMLLRACKQQTLCNGRIRSPLAGTNSHA